MTEAQINDAAHQEIAEWYRQQGLPAPDYVNKYFAQKAQEKANEGSQADDNGGIRRPRDRYSRSLSRGRDRLGSSY